MHMPNADVHKPEFRLDDVPVFLAALRAGNTTRAARLLETDQSTVSRRLVALEAALGVALFDRTGAGLRETDAARAILAYAEQIESAASDVSRVASGFEADPEGLVRLAVPPEIASELVAPRLGRFLEAFPKITIELLTSPGAVDLSRREADIAVDGARPTSGRDLVVSRVAEIAYGIFAARGYLASRGRVRAASDLTWIGWDAAHAMIPEAQWLTALGIPAESCVIRASSVTAHRRAAAGGAGAALLARAVAATEPGLVEVPLPHDVAMTLPIYLVGHQALRQVPRIRAAWDFLATLLTETFPPATPAAAREARAPLRKPSAKRR